MYTKSSASNGRVIGPSSVAQAPQVADREPGRERVGLVDDVLRPPGDPRRSGQLRHDRRVRADLRFAEQATGPGRAQDSLVDEVLADGQLAAGMEDRHPGAGPGAARGAVEDAGERRRPRPVQRSAAHDHRVLGMGARNGGRAGELDDADPRQLGHLGMGDGNLLARGGLHHLAQPNEVPALVRGQPEPERRRLDQRVEHPAPRHVHA